MGAFRQGFAAIALIALAGWANAGQAAAPLGGKHVQPRPSVVVGGERTARLPLTLRAIRTRLTPSPRLKPGDSSGARARGRYSLTVPR